jgi:hypothetical protein
LVRESEFAADLASVLRGEGPREYREAGAFFANTYPTVGLKSLLQNVFQRLSGVGGEANAIFRLDSAIEMTSTAKISEWARWTSERLEARRQIASPGCDRGTEATGSAEE